MGSWRLGRSFPIHVYEGDRPVATFHDPADAQRAVAAVAAVNGTDDHPMCTAIDHEDVPATVIGVYDDGDYRDPQVPYCDACADQDFFTVTKRLGSRPSTDDGLRARVEALERAIQRDADRAYALGDETTAAPSYNFAQRLRRALDGTTGGEQADDLPQCPALHLDGWRCQHRADGHTGHRNGAVEW